MVQALKLINLLVRDSGSQLLDEQVAVMDPFPEAPPFLDLCKRQRELREAIGHTSLKQEIERFLLIGREASETFRTDGVRSLRTKIVGCRSELEELAKEGQCNLASQLIQELVGLCRHSRRREEEGQGLQELVTEVARCLGEIGVVELGCIALVAVDDKRCGQSREGADLRGLWYVSSLVFFFTLCVCVCVCVVSDVDLSPFGRELSAGEQVAAQVLQLLSKLLVDEE